METARDRGSFKVSLFVVGGVISERTYTMPKWRNGF